MNLKGQNLGQMQLNRMKASARCIIFDNGNIPSSTYSALGELNFGLVPSDRLDTCLEQIDQTTRLVVLAGPFDAQVYGDACRRIRCMKFGWSISIYLISKEFEDRTLSARRRTQLDADICLPPSAPSAVISEHLAQSLERRRLLSHHEDIPTGPALTLDRLWDRMQRQDYYDILECSRSSDAAGIRQRFQAIAHIAHPDRHRKWAENNPALKRRISEIYLRLSEIHKVLTHPIKRATYHLCLKSGGSLRYEPSCLATHIRQEIDECETQQGLNAVLQSIDARMDGDWGRACAAMEEALAIEPNNGWLQMRADAVQTVHRLNTQCGEWS